MTSPDIEALERRLREQAREGLLFLPEDFKVVTYNEAADAIASLLAREVEVRRILMVEDDETLAEVAQEVISRRDAYALENRSLLARVREVEAERDAAIESSNIYLAKFRHQIHDIGPVIVARAEAAESELTSLREENERMRPFVGFILERLNDKFLMPHEVVNLIAHHPAREALARSSSEKK